MQNLKVVRRLGPLLGISAVVMIWQMVRIHPPEANTPARDRRAGSSTTGTGTSAFAPAGDRPTEGPPASPGFCAFIDRLAAELHNRSSFELHVERHLTTMRSTPTHPGELDLPPFVGVSSRPVAPKLGLAGTWIKLKSGIQRYYTFHELASKLWPYYQRLPAAEQDARPKGDKDLAPFYVTSVAGPHRYFIQNSSSVTETSSLGALPFFYAFTTPQPGMTRYYLSAASDPGRTKVSTSPQCCGWTDQFSFYAYSSLQGAATLRIYVSVYEDGLAPTFKYSTSGTCCGWTGLFDFYAFPTPTTRDAGPQGPNHCTLPTDLSRGSTTLATSESVGAFRPVQFDERVMAASMAAAHRAQGRVPVEMPEDFGDSTFSGQLQQNRDVLAATRALIDDGAICASESDVFVWMEDDASTCSGAVSHIAAAAAWMKDAVKPPVYIRLSMGFIGIMFHCAHLAEVLAQFEDAVRLDKPGIDWTTAKAFSGRSLTYRWNLFSHPLSGTTASVTGHVSAHVLQRDALQMRCWDLAFGTFVPWNNTFAWPECRAHVASPCAATLFDTAPPLETWGVARPENAREGKPRWFEHTPASMPEGVGVHVAALQQSCTDHCAQLGKVCTDDAMQFANSIPVLEARLPRRYRCSTIQMTWGDDWWLPAVSMGDLACTLRVQKPDCGTAVPPVQEHNRSAHLWGVGQLRRICGCLPSLTNIPRKAVYDARMVIRHLLERGANRSLSNS